MNDNNEEYKNEYNGAEDKEGEEDNEDDNENGDGEENEDGILHIFIGITGRTSCTVY